MKHTENVSAEVHPSFKHGHLTAQQAGIGTREGFANKFTVIEDLAQQGSSELIEAIFAGKSDGIIVRNVVPQKTLDFIKNNVSEWNFSAITPFPFGYCLGKDIMSATEDLTSYTDDTIEHVKGLNHFFGEDYVDRISAIMGKLSSLKVRPAPRRGELTYKPSTIRVIEPNTGHGFIKHIENETFFMPQFRELKGLIYDDIQLGFFMVIQRPENGGDLTLHDLVWEDTPKNLIEDNGINCKLPERDRHLGQFSETRMDLNEGDLIVFDAGRIWHSVSEPLGNLARITVGGFMGLARNGKEIYYWS